MSELKQLNSQLAKIDEAAPADLILDLYERLQRHKKALREFDQEFKAQFVSWLDANGELEYGDKRFYVRTKKTTKPRDKADVADAILDEVQGDLKLFTDYLSSQPFLAGATRKLLGDDDFATLFSTETAYEVAVGKPKKAKRELAVVDMKYVTQANRQERKR